LRGFYDEAIKHANGNQRYETFIQPWLLCNCHKTHTFYESSLQHTAAEASVSEASTILHKQYVHYYNSHPLMFLVRTSCLYCIIQTTSAYRQA